MRTEEDLRTAMERLADQAPHPGDIRLALRSHRRRSRRTALIVGTAIATATAAVAATVVPHLISTDPATPADQSIPVLDHSNSAWSRWVELHLPDHIVAVNQQFTANRQTYELEEVVQVTWPEFCQLQLSRNGDFDPATIPAGSATVQIGGHQARMVTSSHAKPFLRGIDPLEAAVQKTLVWQPVNGVWALLSCESQQKLGTKQAPTTDGPYETNLSMATSLAASFSGTAPLGSPVKVGGLPTGVAPRRINYAPSIKGQPGSVNYPESGQDFTVTAGDGSAATGFQPVPPKPHTPVWTGPSDPGRGDDLQIRVITGTRASQLSRFPGQFPSEGTIHGLKAYYFAGQIIPGGTDKDAPRIVALRAGYTLRLEGNGVAVEFTTYAKNPTKDELRSVAESLQLAKTPSQPATWFDAATALP
ncbi:hypothetical protein [Kribbella sp. NPDC055071]